jgi:hypothetical protein
MGDSPLVAQEGESAGNPEIPQQKVVLIEVKKVRMSVDVVEVVAKESSVPLRAEQLIGPTIVEERHNITRRRIEAHVLKIDHTDLSRGEHMKIRWHEIIMGYNKRVEFNSPTDLFHERFHSRSSIG